jgi:integration host factor subunit beta
MNKAALIDRVAVTVQLPQSQADAVVTIFLQGIIDALRAGEHVELRGFGSFRLHHRQARVGRNPKTGAMVQIPAREVPWFKAGKDLLARVNRHARC